MASQERIKLSVTHHGRKWTLSCTPAIATLLRSSTTDPAVKSDIVMALIGESQGTSTGNMSNSTENVSNSTGSMSNSTGSMSNSTGSTGSMSNSTGNMSNSTGSMSNSTGSMSNSTGSMSNSTGSMSNSTGTSGSTGSMSNSTGSMSNSTGNMSNSTGSMSNSTGNMSNSTGSMSNSTGSMSNSTAYMSTSTTTMSENVLGSEIIYHVWKEKEEDFLVDQRHERHDDFKQIKNHTKLWTEISEVINRELKCTVTPQQCCNKYNALKKKWKEIIDSPSGSERKYFRHKTAFDNIFGNKASTKPRNVLDSLDEPKDLKAENVNNIKNIAKGKKRKKDCGSEVINLFNEQYEDFKHEINQQHKAKMLRMDRFLDLYEKEINKKEQGDN